jgi:RNA polymerase sigma-70 factor, ECF subfamily
MRFDDQPDEVLLVATKRNPAAFAPVYERHAPAILAYLRRRTGSTEVAVELAAEVFAAALVSASRYRQEHGPVRAWLVGIANHKLGDARRKARHSASALRRLGIQSIHVSEAGMADLDERLTAQAEGQLALQLLADLPQDQRDAVLARVVDEQDYADLALRFQTTEVNVRARVHRGLRKLSALMIATQE